MGESTFCVPGCLSNLSLSNMDLPRICPYFIVDSTPRKKDDGEMKKEEEQGDLGLVIRHLGSWMCLRSNYLIAGWLAG